MTAWPEVRIDATAAPSSHHTLAELLPQDCHASATLDEILRAYPLRALRRSAAATSACRYGAALARLSKGGPRAIVFVIPGRASWRKLRCAIAHLSLRLRRAPE